MIPQENSEIPPPSTKRGSDVKWYATIVVLLVIVAAFGIMAFYHPSPVIPVGTTASVVTASSLANYDLPYNLSIKTNGQFNNIVVYWGDGSPQVVPYSGSDYVNVSHKYTSPGNYYVFFVMNSKNGIFSSNKQLVPVAMSATYAALPETSTYGDIALQSSSSSPVVNSSWIYGPGTSLSLLLAYFTPPANPSFQVVSQTLSVSHNGSVVDSISLPYYYNASAGMYELPISSAIYNLTLSTGYYQLQVTTYTAAVNASSGSVDTSQGIFKASYFTDVPVFETASLYSSAPSTNGTFINAELEVGGYVTLDPQVAADSVSGEIIINTMATLVDYNGSDSSGYHAYLASYLPTTSNGGINTNWSNYTVHVNSTKAGYSGAYNVTIKPYENYTFHIRSNATFADGSKVTAWDVAFSIIRDLLYVAGSPATPGSQIAQYLLPGNYFASNTFWNITQNITWDNATNNITFHFQNPMTPSLVYQTVGKSVGTPVVEASWVQAHGGGIGWNASDFQAYQATGSAGHYISYLRDHVMASGPYIVDYTVPASETVLVANPNYNPPGNGWNPKPKINMIILEYIGQESTQYLQLKSGYATAAYLFPTGDWFAIEPLLKSGAVKAYSYPSSAMEFYCFNTQINTTILSHLDPQANVPQAFFDSVQVRRAFADAYNYSFYLAQQVGNEVYNTTFVSGYAGAIPSGVVGYQSNDTLKAAGVSLPSFNMAYAAQNWSTFTHSSYFSLLGLTTGSGGTILYQGAPLNIPIFVLAGDPVNSAGATTWADNLASIVPGASFTVTAASLPEVYSFLVPDQNPAPLWWLEFGGLYPSPTQYLPIVAVPSGNSLIPAPNGFNPSWFNSSSNPVSSLPGMVEQYDNLTAMVEDYLVGFSTGNPTVSLQHFEAVNEMLVNMTFYVPLGQPNQIYLVSSHISPASFINYNENTFAYTEYNYLEFI